MLACVVDGVTRDLNDQIFVGDARLTAQAAVRFQSPGFIQHIVFIFGTFRQRVKAFTHDAVAGGAGTGFFAGVFNLDAAAEQVRAAAAGDDADAIKEAIKNIDTQTQEFAARRMDQSVRIALKGQSVDEV